MNAPNNLRQQAKNGLMRAIQSIMKTAFFSIILALSTLVTIAEPIRVACVGDSITYGAAIKNRAANCYPTVLGKLLGKGYEVRNFGVNGATLLKKGDRPYWRLGAFKAATDFAPQIVIIKLGTNDTKPQNWGKAAADFEADLRALAAHFRGLPSKPKVYLCLPVPVYQDRWGINEKTVTKGVIPVIQKVAKAEKLPVINLYQALSGKPKMFPDKIHPNAAGAEVMAKAIFASLREAKK